ncbi:AI-2E family transporter [Oscillatoria sp. FACHB-1407]|uniref:AI-2E family transporter n=1 Tax=Oscillatoria sp. FACHB-1407 TaxID=2692847 RepID=UPI0016893D52|nr:AI-2E family transporter [Oscillatoria sp. FACHB-1407]MBD2465125.1 AI-2E family transporter [Oscillatoria sp. FACHB-1407]
MKKVTAHTNSLWTHLTNARLVRYLLLFALAWAIAQVLAYFETVLVIFIFAAILSFLLNYPVKWACRVIPHWLAVTLVFLITLFVFGGLMATLGLAAIAQTQQFLEQAPQLLESAIAVLNGLQSFLRSRNITVDFSTFEAQLREQALGIIGMGFATLQSVLFSLLDLILIAVVSFFMLLDGQRLWGLLMKLFPSHLRQELTVAIQKNFLGFFWGRFLLFLFFSASAFLVFIVLDIPYALVMAAIAGVFDLIPGIGATIGISLVCLIILPQGILLSLKVLISCVLLQQIEENLLMPRIMQGSINMNPVIMFFALLVGARVAGLVGVFLSIPIAGVIISFLDVDEIRGDQTTTESQ